MLLVVKRTVSDKTSLLFSSNFWKDEEKQETNVPTNCKSISSQPNLGSAGEITGTPSSVWPSTVNVH
jgi:hypothetical protein